MDSKRFEWHEVDHEHFDHNDDSYDVNKAKRIIKDFPRPIYWIPVEKLKKDARSTGIDRTADKKVKLQIPIIMITLDNEELLCIDGYHRIKKAIRLNKENNNKIDKLPCVVLSKKETQSILMK
jgi:hypothetical protein